MLIKQWVVSVYIRFGSFTYLQVNLQLHKTFNLMNLQIISETLTYFSLQKANL